MEKLFINPRYRRAWRQRQSPEATALGTIVSGVTAIKEQGTSTGCPVLFRER